MHRGAVHPEHTPFGDRISRIAILLYCPFIAPIGHRCRHHTLFSNKAEPITAPDVMSSSRLAESAPLSGRFHSSSHIRIPANRPYANGGPTVFTSAGHDLSCAPVAFTACCTSSPVAMNGHTAHHIRLSSGYDRSPSGHHHAQNTVSATLLSRVWGPMNSIASVATKTGGTT